MKIQPSNESDSKKLLDPQDETEEKANIQPIEPTRCAACFSMRIFIILLITSLLLCCCSFIWLASFIGSRQALNSLSGDLMTTFGESVLRSLHGQIYPYIGATKTVADDYNIGLVPKFPPASYLFTKYSTFRPYGIGLVFTDELHTYNTYGVPPNEITAYYETPKGKFLLLTYGVNSTSGAIQYDNLLKNTTNYATFKQSYWTTCFDLFPKLNTDGVFGDPYYVPGGGYTLYFCAKLYDPVQYANGQKNVVGIAKTNLSLNLVQQFLLTLKVFGTGFVLVSEVGNDLVIGGNINTTALDKISRVSMFDLIDRNAGNLMKLTATKYGNLSSSPSEFAMESLGVSYMVSRTVFTLENLQWNVWIVLRSDEVELSTNISTGISIGITVAIIIVGISLSALIGYIVTAPLNYLEREFQKIKTMELEEVYFIASRFKEVDRIYAYLHEMVVWLNEIKSFIPESVFLQLKAIKQEAQDMEMTIEKGGDLRSSVALTRESMSRRSSHSSNRSASSTMKKEGGNSLFKLGLNLKECGVIRIHLPDFCKTHSPHEVTNIFTKISSGLSVIAKSIQADFQVLSIDEYQLNLSEDGTSKKSLKACALDSSLKFVKLIQNINSTRVSAHKMIPIRVCIGVSVGKCWAGNVGSNAFRTFSIVGGLTENARRLTVLCDALDCKILADESTMDEDIQKQFVARPVDRLLEEPPTLDKANPPVISSIFEVVKENVVESDEWLYELSAKKSNQQFSEYQRFFVFSKNMHNMTEEEILDMLKISETDLEEYIGTNINDNIVSSKLLAVIRRFITMYDSGRRNAIPLPEMIAQYHSKLECQVEQVFIDNQVDTVEYLK